MLETWCTMVIWPCGSLPTRTMRLKFMLLAVATLAPTPRCPLHMMLAAARKKYLRIQVSMAETQKKYFGGLHLSDELYKWATTSGASLGDLFVSRQVSEDRYSSRHSLACDVDTMFHPMQGAIGVRLEEVRYVSMKNVDVRNLRNLGDQHGPTCQARWRLLSNKEDIVPERSVADEGGGANARGLHVKVSQQVELKDVSITHIDSDEGFAIGIDIASDQNDRSDYRDRRAVTFDDVRVDALTAGRKSMVARLGDDQFNMKEFKTGQPVDNGNWFKPPKLVIKQEQGCCSNRVCLNFFGQK